jgi:hypothetical protein
VSVNGTRHAALLAVGMAACSHSGNDEPVQRPYRDRTSLVEPRRFELMDAAGDPFDDRPSDPDDCADSARLAEDLGGVTVFSIQTEACPYATVAQPSLTNVYEGEFLRARVWHFALLAPEPAEAHLVVGLEGGEWGLEERISLPADAVMLSKIWRATRDYPAGTPVFFHVHNHGNNEYLLAELSTGTADPAQADGGPAAASL